MNYLLAPIAALGRVIITFITETGSILILLFLALRNSLRRPYRFKLILEQMEFIGVNSMGIITLTGFFTGAVFALQTGKVFRLFNAEGYTGMVVGISLVRELAPVLTSLMVAARAGSAIAAKLGTMRVTHQIDALMVMAVDPVNYLIVPRFIATTLVMPVLTAYFDFIGILGSYVVGVVLLATNEGIFVYRIEWMVDVGDISHGLIKSSVFGALIAIISCHKGFYSGGGAEGVGRSTTEAVVLSSISIFVADYVITALVI